MTDSTTYFDWADEVGRALGSAWREHGRPWSGVSHEQIAAAIPLELDDLATECLEDALRDLKRLGLADNEGSALGAPRWQPTQEGLKFPDASLRSLWGQIFSIFLDEDQLDFLSALSAMSEERFEKCARVNWIQAAEVMQRLGVNWDEPDTKVRGYRIVERLGELGLVVDEGGMGGHLPAHPTYAGIVRATQQEPNEWRELVEGILPEWETTNVDFKRELNLARDAEKAEFVRDALALTNTKSSGRRFVVIGFDDKSRSFAQTFDLTVTQERLEQILHAYAEPAPTLRLHTLPWPGGTVGLVEFIREETKLPYVATRSLSKLQAGVVYVRHGSHTESATPAEEQALREEGERARQAAL